MTGWASPHLDVDAATHSGGHEIRNQIGPKELRPRCKRCGGKWNGGYLLFCDACEDQYLDLYDECLGDDEPEEPPE